ncbi:hypothetical protein BU25DRAFT_314880, partial [Macroventuria anomochaeta]
RYLTAAEQLGWSILCLMPHDQVTSTWVEQTLRVPEWELWLKAVEKVNPIAVAVSHELDTWLGPAALAGGPITQQELLIIEARSMQAVLSSVEIQN